MKKSNDYLYREEFHLAVLDILLICFILMLCIILYKSILDVTVYDFFDLFLPCTIIFIFTIIFANFRKLVVTLYPEFIEARFGLIAKKIMIKDIKSISKYKYKFSEFLGWGIRISFRGRMAFNAPDDNFSGLLINYSKNEKNKDLFVSLRKPDLLFEKLKELDYKGIID